MIRAAIVSAVVLGLAAPVGAAGVKKDRVDLLVSLICKNGGSMRHQSAEILKHGFVKNPIVAEPRTVQRRQEWRHQAQEIGLLLISFRSNVGHT